MYYNYQRKVDDVMEEFIYSINKKDLNRSLSQYPLYINCIGTTKCIEGIDNIHFRYDFSLMYVQEGSLSLHTSQVDVTLKKGELIIVPPYTTIAKSSKKGDNVHYLWMHFTGSNAEELLKNVHFRTNRVYNIGVHYVFSNYWKSLYRECIINDEYAIKAIATILTSVFYDLARYTKKQLTSYSLKTIRYIHENLAQDYDLKKLAYIENLSKSRYSALFTEIMGTSPINYIIDLRINTAADLLTNSNRSISEISKYVGYEDPFYFSRLFKSRTGISPVAYRKETQKN